MAKTKRVLLFVVEGSTDETALALILERCFSESRIAFDIMSGDITTKALPERETIVTHLRKKVIAYVENKPYRWTDIEKIILITDLDGAFIPAENVLQHEGELHYELDAIKTNNVDGIRKRNERKAKALQKLIATPCITYKKCRVPFFTYFMSRNLEHALHGVEAELDVKEKEELARQFQLQYALDITGFISFMNSEKVAVQGTYQETWDYVQAGTSSLHRGSNLHLFLKPKDQE